MVVSELRRQDGWRDIEEGSIPKSVLQSWIKGYFRTIDDLSGFERRNVDEGVGLELRSSEGDGGYVFVGPSYSIGQRLRWKNG